MVCYSPQRKMMLTYEAGLLLDTTPIPPNGMARCVLMVRIAYRYNI